MHSEFKDFKRLYNSIEDLEVMFHNTNSNGGHIDWDEFGHAVKNVIDLYNDLYKKDDGNSNEKLK